MGAPLWCLETYVHHSNSRFSWQVTLTARDHLFADFTTSESALRKNRVTGTAKCKNYAFLAKEARAFTLTNLLRETVLQINPFARAAMSSSFTVGARNSSFSKSKVMPR